MDNKELNKELSVYELLESYRAKQGGPFDLHFDEDRAREILEKFKDWIVRKTPGTGSINPLAWFTISKQLQNCLIPHKSLFEGLNCDEYDIMESKYDQTKEVQLIEINSPTKLYNRQRVPFGTKEFKAHIFGGKSKVESTPRIPRGYLDIVEGVEFTNPNVKWVCFTFNGMPIEVAVDSIEKVFVKCPFLIAYRYLCYVQLGIEFLDCNRNHLGYNFDSWIIGGQLNFDIIDMQPICVLFDDPITGKTCCARYNSNMLGFSLDGCIHGECVLLK